MIPEASKILPPELAIGEKVLCVFLNQEEQINVLGDLAEEYQNCLSRSGKTRAYCWFYGQALLSLPSLSSRLLKEAFIGVCNRRRH